MDIYESAVATIVFEGQAEVGGPVAIGVCTVYFSETAGYPV